MRSLLSQLLALTPELAAFILTSPLLGARGAYAISQSTIPSPNLDLGGLGRVAVGGDFDSISLYTYDGQNEDVFNTNGSQSLLTRYPNGAFQSLGLADAYIMTMCPFVQDGSLQGVIVGGNFTSLGGVEAQAIALWNPNTTQITALPGLSGKVNAVYCDADSGTVYVGGAFMAGNSTNAMAWTSGWNNLPFEGFNGPVTSITKNMAGNIVFGGNFDGLGNTTTPERPDGQAINLGSGDITAMNNSTDSAFGDPSNIICKTASDDGAGNTFLLADQTAGYWQGNFSFGFNPTKLRLYQTQQSNRGTKTWYFEDLNSGGILNLNYLDTDGNNQSCSNECTLPESNSTYQDFHFVPPVGMNAFRIQITDWYGDGAGLDGIELFQDDIYSFAVNAFNEPQCDGVSNGSSSIASPSSLWTQSGNMAETSSDYLTAYLNDSSEIGPNVSVVFTPDIKQSGNYSITVYTPGCLQDDTCATRGMVNVTGTMTSDTPPVTTTLYQTNDYDKFDQVYYGYVDIDSDAFKPSVTLSPQAGQNVPLTVVAQRVRFELVTTTGGLNGLFEYNPNQAVVNTDFSQSAIDSAGASLHSDAQVNAIVSSGSTLYVAGNFSANGISNVMSIGSNATALPNGGLNSEVQTVYANGSILYMGGNFTNTADNSVDGLNNIASFHEDSKTWAALGAGVDGVVYSLVPLSLNITSGDVEDCITVNGDFTSVNGFGSNDAFDATGFAVWVPSRSNWLQNIPDKTIAISGKLVTYTTVPGFSPLYAGQLSLQAGYSGAVELLGSGQPSLQSLGIQIQPSNSSSSSSSKRRRAIAPSQSYTGVYNGLFYGDSGLNITILGGRFAAKASNGSTAESLIFVNNTATPQTITGVSGLDSDSTFIAMATYETSLYAGGAVSGTVNGNPVNGLIVYNLATSAYAGTQPPALTGDDVVVNSVALQPSSANVYVGGIFSGAGSLPCGTLCYYDAEAEQWNTPASGLSGTINSMVWSSKRQLIIAGNLTVNGNSTTMVTYDAKHQTYQQYAGADSLPGPITALTPADKQYNGFWAAGTATNNGSGYLSKYSNNAWTSVSGLGDGTSIRGLQVISLQHNHDSSDLVPNDEVLMITGNVNVASFGNASAVLFNGTTYQPFILTNRQDGSQGSISSMFVSKPSALMHGHGGHLALGLVVLIGLAIALALIFLMVVAGILMERARRRREGYVPMQMDKNGNLQRIPPESLLGRLTEKDSPPKL